MIDVIIIILILCTVYMAFVILLSDIGHACDICDGQYAVYTCKECGKDFCDGCGDKDKLICDRCKD